MSSPQQFYAPQNPDYLDNINYTQRVVDSILRNNPLHNAVVGSGLVRFIGNYTDAGDPNKINYVWIGEFLPADTNLPGNPPQRGISMVRDDSRGGVTAFAIFDDNPAGGGGLRQTIHIYSGDNQQLFVESRNGGWRFPETNVAMGAHWSDFTKWPNTTSGTFDTLFEGRCPVVGNQLAYRFQAATFGGASGEFRLRVPSSPADIIGTVHTLGTNTNTVFDSTLDITSQRGLTVPVFWEGRVSAGAGSAASTYVSVRNFTP